MMQCSAKSLFSGLLFTFAMSTLSILDAATLQNATTSANQNGDTTISTETLEEKLERLSRCTLTPISPTLSSDIRGKLDDGARLIHMYLTIVNHTGPFPGELKSEVFKPLRWTRSTGKMGRGLMMLKNTYNILSFNTLNYGVEYMYNFTLTQNPTDCLSSMDIYDVQEYLRRFLLNDAKGIILNGTEDIVGNSSQEICNFEINIENEFDFGYFHYECCHLNKDMKLICERLLPNVWITAIIVCVFVLNIIAIFFSPYFVPATIYQAHEEPVIYEHKLTSPTRIIVKKAANRSSYSDKEISFENVSSRDMSKFQDVLDSSNMEMNTPYSLAISKLLFYVPSAKLLSSSCAPVGLISTLYNRVFLCKVKKDERIYTCCDSSMKPFKKYKWQFCLRRTMHAFLLLLAIVPWIIRVSLYYIYEDKELTDMRQAANLRQINAYYIQASFAVRYLTPIHIVFIICYLIIVVDSLVLGLVFNAYLFKFQRILTRCFHDMDAYVRYSTFEWMLNLLIWPLEKIGLYALPFIAVYWAIMIIVLSPMLLYYFVPTINIWIRLFLHWCAYICPPWPFLEKLLLKSLHDTDQLPIRIPWRKRLFEFFIVNMCLLTMSSYLFLAAECITFFVEILVYTLVGIILNAQVTLKYVSLFLMLTLYARDTFGSVSRKYTKYNESLINALRQIEKKQVDDLGICDKNVALKAKDMGFVNEIQPELRIKGDDLKWRLHHVFIFIDKKMNAFRISKNFFFNTIHMDINGCPGYLFSNFMQAFRQLLLIMVFLMFVFLVVSAFGDQYEVSGVSQMLATLVGGFLPWIFSNILFRDKFHSNFISTDSATFSTFKSFLFVEVNKFEQSWAVADFDVKPESLRKCDNETDTDCDLIIVCNTQMYSERNSTSEACPMNKSV